MWRDLSKTSVIKNGAKEAFAAKDWLLCFTLIAALVHAIDTMHAELRTRKI
jgi:hypothetical protein